MPRCEDITDGCRIHPVHSCKLYITISVSV